MESSGAVKITTNRKGRFCNVSPDVTHCDFCNKNITDFTEHSVADIKKAYSADAAICGKFYYSQVYTDEIVVSIPSSKIKPLLFSFLFFIAGGGVAKAQNKNVKPKTEQYSFIDDQGRTIEINDSLCVIKEPAVAEDSVVPDKQIIKKRKAKYRVVLRSRFPFFYIRNVNRRKMGCLAF